MNCLRNENYVVKYACPGKEQASEIINKLIPKILETCPKKLKPKWFEGKKLYRFKNGSEIHVRGTDNKQHEKLRGGECHMGIVDEA
jgi:hypothetical protein